MDHGAARRKDVERRISIRGETEFPVFETEGNRKMKAKAADLSATGIGLVCYDKPDYEPQVRVQLELHLPGMEQPLRVGAEPVWVEGFRIGFKFVEIGDADRLNLAEFLDQVNKDGPGPS